MLSTFLAIFANEHQGKLWPTAGGGIYLYQEKEPQQHRIQAAAKIHNTYLYKMCFFESQTL